VGLVLRLLGGCLVVRGLERPRIDLCKNVALFDELSFVEGDLVDLPVNPSSHYDGVKTLHIAKAGQVNREIGLFDRRDLDGNRGRAATSLLGAARLFGLGGEEVLTPSHITAPRYDECRCQQSPTGGS